MLNAKALANAVTAITAMFYIVCVVLSYLAPDMIFSLARSWMHTVNLESVKTTYNFDLGLLVYGFVTATVLTWVTTYATIVLYNRWVK